MKLPFPAGLRMRCPFAAYGFLMSLWDLAGRPVAPAAEDAGLRPWTLVPLALAGSDNFWSPVVDRFNVVYWGCSHPFVSKPNEAAVSRARARVRPAR